jgi:hypothetical protein
LRGVSPYLAGNVFKHCRRIIQRHAFTKVQLSLKVIVYADLPDICIHEEADRHYENRGDNIVKINRKMIRPYCIPICFEFQIEKIPDCNYQYQCEKIL